MIVLYVILNGDLTSVYYRDENLEACVHPYACVVGLGNEYIERERNRTYRVTCPLSSSSAPSPNVNPI